MLTSPDGVLEEYATTAEVNGIRRTLDSFMKDQELRNTSMENTLDKILGKLDKLCLDTPPGIEDKGSNAKSKPVIHTNKSLHFGPPHPNTNTHFYNPPGSTRAQYVQATDVGMSTTNPEMVYIDYDLHDCPWSDLELEAFYELANRDMTPLQHTSAQIPQKQAQPFLSTPATAPYHTVNPIQQPFQSHLQFQQKMVAK